MVICQFFKFSVFPRNSQTGVVNVPETRTLAAETPEKCRQCPPETDIDDIRIEGRNGDGAGDLLRRRRHHVVSFTRRNACAGILAETDFSTVEAEDIGRAGNNGI